jgi:D-xylose transport system substrate-binding protein
MLPHLNSKRYLVERDAFTAKVEGMGGKVIFKSADNDEEKQIQQLKEIMKEGIDLLVLDPVNRFRGAEMVRMAHDKGIKVISYDRLVANCDVDALVTFDANAIGKQMVDYALSKKPSGNYIILSGDKSDINAVMVNDAVVKELEPSVKSGNVKILYKTYIETYSEKESENVISTCLRLSPDKPDVVITSGDAMVQGVLSALEKEKVPGPVITTGQNADLFALKSILAGKQSMTIYKGVKKMASTTAEIAVKLSKGENIKNFFKSTLFNGSVDVPAYFFDVITVDASNLKSTVIADGFYTEDEVYN